VHMLPLPAEEYVPWGQIAQPALPTAPPEPLVPLYPAAHLLHDVEFAVGTGGLQKFEADGSVQSPDDMVHTFPAPFPERVSVNSHPSDATTNLALKPAAVTA